MFTKSDILLAVQALLIFLQMLNASRVFGDKVTLIVAAFIGAVQFFLQNAGNKMNPTPLQIVPPAPAPEPAPTIVVVPPAPPVEKK